MMAFLIDALPWVLSALMVLQLWRAADGWRWAWALLLFNQALWIVWIMLTQSWGLIPGNLALVVVAVRNHHKWNRGISHAQD